MEEQNPSLPGLTQDHAWLQDHILHLITRVFIQHLPVLQCAAGSRAEQAVTCAPSCCKRSRGLAVAIHVGCRIGDA